MQHLDAAARPAPAFPPSLLDDHDDVGRMINARSRLEDHIARLIDYLDALDEDPDHEPTADELFVRYDQHLDDSLDAAFGRVRRGGVVALEFDDGDERELDLDLEEGDPTEDLEPGGDGEHTLGWSEGGSLRGALYGGSDDYESELGWPANVGQLHLGEAHYADGDNTAVETHGQGFPRSPHIDDREPTLGWPESRGAGLRIGMVDMQLVTRDGEHEDGHDAEAVNEDGTNEDGLEPGAHFGDHADHGIADQGGVSDALGQDFTANIPGGDVLGADEKHPHTCGN